MKKIVAIILASIMLLAFASCGNNNNGGETTTDADTTTAAPGETTSAELTTAAPEETTAEASNDIIPTVDEKTLGGKLWAIFLDTCKSNPSATTEEIANAVSSISEIQFMKMVSPIEPGLLAGFDNTEIKGFKSGHAFGPMIGSIPFICYIFELEDGADVAAFVKNLTDSANPRWNICVEAKQTIAGSCGNYVFFVMCPDSMQ